MIIPCPHCGDRDSSEFFFRGEARPQRPQYDDGIDAFVDHVYERLNIAGPQKEHCVSCRWLPTMATGRTRYAHACISVGDTGI